jgi:phosphoribosylformylglycinamidine cyclo-ligase
MRAPVLVASTDGVGTKTRLAARLGRYRGLGLDIVNHCLNDILVQGARPLLFLDYVAMPASSRRSWAEIVEGAAEACRAGGCALLGGETAEMPGVYAEGELDLVGTVVGSVEREEMIDGSSLVAGDAVLGLPSSGLHTNGYSLARRALENADLGADRGGAPSASAYSPRTAPTCLPSRSSGGRASGSRRWPTSPGEASSRTRRGVFPPGLGAVLFEGSWPVPPIFREIVGRGAVEPGEARRAFNMGLGMLVFVGAGEAEARARGAPAAGEAAYRVGETVPGSGRGLRMNAPEARPLELWLVRHGETTWNAEGRWQGQADAPLTERGREQARRLARRLAGQRFDAVYASDLGRALETAEVVAAELEGRPPASTPSPGCARPHVGAFSGLTRFEVEERGLWRPRSRLPRALPRRRVAGGAHRADRGRPLGPGLGTRRGTGARRLARGRHPGGPRLRAGGAGGGSARPLRPPREHLGHPLRPPPRRPRPAPRLQRRRPPRGGLPRPGTSPRGRLEAEFLP